MMLFERGKPRSDQPLFEKTVITIYTIDVILENCTNLRKGLKYKKATQITCIFHKIYNKHEQFFMQKFRTLPDLSQCIQESMSLALGEIVHKKILIK